MTSLEPLSSAIDSIHYPLLLEMPSVGCQDTVFSGVSSYLSDQFLASFIGLSPVHLLNNSVAVVSVFGPLPLLLDSLLKQSYPLMEESQVYSSSRYRYSELQIWIFTFHLDIFTSMFHRYRKLNGSNWMQIIIPYSPTPNQSVLPPMFCWIAQHSYCPS